MNKADSERLESALGQMGLAPRETPSDADVIVLNSCVVRKSAEDRVVGMVTSLKPLKQLPSDYVKEHCYWGFVYNPVGVRTMAREVGVDRIMWATDFPHAESDWPHSQRVISESMGELSEGDRNKVIAGNAVGFFRLNA
jgi:predicted TIM-barrel fold metal-dependent hydrolase